MERIPNERVEFKIIGRVNRSEMPRCRFCCRNRSSANSPRDKYGNRSLGTLKTTSKLKVRGLDTLSSSSATRDRFVPSLPPNSYRCIEALP